MMRWVLVALAAIPATSGWGLKEALRVKEVSDALGKSSEGGDTLPIGPYFATCGKCSVSSTPVTVTCKCLKASGGKGTTSKRVDDCSADEWISNNAGTLSCERMPAGTKESIKELRDAGNDAAASIAEQVMHVAWRVGGTTELRY